MKFEVLKELYESLSSEEKDLLISRRGKKRVAPKRELLLETLCSGLVSTDKDAKKIIYNKENTTAYYHLKRRLLTDIMSVVSSDAASNVYSADVAIVRHEVRQLIVGIEQLLVQGKYQVADKLILDVDRSTYKYELFPEIMMLIDIKERHLSKRHPPAYLDKLRKEKKSIMAAIKELDDATYNFYSVVGGETNRSSTMQAIAQLEKQISGTSSKQAMALLFRAKAYYHNQTNNLASALKYANDYLDLVRTSSFHRSDSNIAGAHMQKAMILGRMKKFENAINEINKSISIFKIGSNNQIVALNVKAIIGLIACDQRISISAIKRIESNLKKRESFLANELLFLRKSQYEFCFGDYDDFLLCNDLGAPYFKKKRILQSDIQIMTLVRLAEFIDADILDYRIRAFRRKKSNNRDEYYPYLEFLSSVVSGSQRSDGIKRLVSFLEKDVDKHDPFESRVLTASVFLAYAQNVV